MEHSPATITRKYDYAAHLAAVIEKPRRPPGTTPRRRASTAQLDYTWVEIPETDDNAAEWVLTLTTSGDFALGDYTPVAVVDFTAIDTGLVLTIDDTVEIGDDLDPTRCDACHRGIRRNKIVVVTDGTDLIHVGGSCAQDFLGRDPEMLTWIGEAIDGTPGEPKVYPTRMVIAAAIEACRIGYTKANSEIGTPTKNIVHAMLTGRFATARDYEYERVLAEASAARHTVDEVLAWMLNDSGTGDFGANMKRLASPTPSAHGASGSPPTPRPVPTHGGTRWPPPPPSVPPRKPARPKPPRSRSPTSASASRASSPPSATSSRTGAPPRRSGSRPTRAGPAGAPSPAGCEAGSPWNEDGSWKDEDEIEAEAGRGDRVAFMARIEASADDDKFGFFTRPTKGEIIARAEVEVAASTDTPIPR